MRNLKNLLTVGIVIAIAVIIWIVYTVLTQNPATESAFNNIISKTINS